MKKVLSVLCAAAIFITSGCSGYSKESADKLVEDYMRQKQQQQESNILNETDEIKEPVYTYLDCDWDMYEELTQGNLFVRLFTLLKQAYTADNVGSVPYGMLIADVPGGQEWYYNFNQNNTLKFIISSDYTVEMYYSNPENISADNNDIYTQAMIMDICNSFGCNEEDLSIADDGMGITNVSTAGFAASFGITDNDLMSLKLTMEA